MTILQVNKFYYRRGGADHHFFDLMDLLESKGHKVIAFSMKDKRNYPSAYQKYFVSHAEFGGGGWNAVASSGRIIYSREAKKNITALVKDEKPKVAHLHLIYHHLSPSILVALKETGVKTVMTVHDWKPICPAYSLFTEGEVCERCRGGHYIQCFKHRCIKNSRPASLLGSIEAYIHHAKRYYEDYIDLLIAPSEFVKEKFIYFGWPENKIRVLPHFLPNNFPRVSAPPSIPNERRFAYIGRLSPEKGILELVNYWIKAGWPYVLDIFGDGPLKGQIARMIDQGRAASRVCLRGQMSRENIFGGLDHFTAIIMPSVCWETFGLTAIESFARGVPAIMSKRGAFIELAEKSGAGILFDWREDNLHVALNEAENQIYRDRAVSYMSGHHMVDDYYDKLVRIYAELTAK